MKFKKRKVRKIGKVKKVFNKYVLDLDLRKFGIDRNIETLFKKILEL